MSAPTALSFSSRFASRSHFARWELNCDVVYPMTLPQSSAQHFFVDEAGDLTLFDRRGRAIVGSEGVSHLFVVGVAAISDVSHVEHKLAELRSALLADPYFKDVPSMRPEARKTYLCFHAKDDVPEVRREVLRILPTLGAKVQVAIRRKSDLAIAARVALERYGRRLNPNEVYDDLISRLFRNVLHKSVENHIVFAHRGKRQREQALRSAIDRAKRNFRRSHGIAADRPTSIRSAYPSQFAGLQIIDYYLWALQRLFERREDRFFQLLQKDYRLIMDLDDTRAKPYGEWYSDSNPLTLEKIRPCEG
jgi:hypothetical protein